MLLRDTGVFPQLVKLSRSSVYGVSHSPGLPTMTFTMITGHPWIEPSNAAGYQAYCGSNPGSRPHPSPTSKRHVWVERSVPDSHYITKSFTTYCPSNASDSPY